VRFLRLAELGDWRVKIYGITAHQNEVNPELIGYALRAAAQTLPSPAITADRYGMGFVIVHEGASDCYVLVHWWAVENEIHQSVLSAPLEHPERLTQHNSPAIGCVWELSVTDFERRAWIDRVLTSTGAADVEGYLASEFNDDV
jgi:hypothetical protein